MSSTFGKLIKITTYGESHGVALGVVIEGIPAGVTISLEQIQKELDRRKPGQSTIVTQRKEGDKFEITSGVFEDKSTGTPISVLIRNENQKSKDYDHIKDKYRPSHADFTYDQKYNFRDYRGGGRSSARETGARVAAGAIAKQFLNQIAPEITINSYVNSVGEIEINKPYQELNLTKIDSNDVRCPDEKVALQMIDKIKEVKKQGDTIGGTVVGVIQNVPAGLGEPIFDKLHAELSKAMLSIPAVKGFEFGSGFEGTKMMGSAHNDLFLSTGETATNHSGGIQGGISNGEDIYFKVAFKPVATIMRDQSSIDVDGNEVTVTGKGRHDACVLPRAVPIVDAMCYLIIADFWLRNKLSKIENLKA